MRRFSRAADKRSGHPYRAPASGNNKRGIQSRYKPGGICRRESGSGDPGMMSKGYRHQQTAQRDSQNIPETESNVIHRRCETAMLGRHHRDHCHRIGRIENSVGDGADNDQEGGQEPMRIDTQEGTHTERNNHERNADSSRNARPETIGEMTARRRQRYRYQRCRHK